MTSLKKHDNQWQIATPAMLEADQSEVSTLLTSLETLEIQRTLDEKPAALKPFELDPPRFSVGVRLAGETAMRRVNFGSKTPTGADLYATIEGQPKLLLVSAYVEDSLNKTPFSFREKSILKFSRDGVDSLTKEAQGNPTVVLTKKGTDWRLVKPVDAKADFGSVDTLIGKIAQAKMKAIVAPEAGKPAAELTPADLKKYGLDKPQAVATIGAGSTRASLAIGGKVDDSTVYTRDLSRPMVFTVESTLLEDLKRKPDDLRVKDVFAFRTFNALGVDLTFGGQTYTFEKQKATSEQQSTTAEVWKQTKPSAKDVESDKTHGSPDDDLEPAGGHVHGQAGRLRRGTDSRRAPRRRRRRPRPSGWSFGSPEPSCTRFAPASRARRSCRRPISTKPSRLSRNSPEPSEDPAAPPRRLRPGVRSCIDVLGLILRRHVHSFEIPRPPSSLRSARPDRPISWRTSTRSSRIRSSRGPSSGFASNPCRPARSCTNATAASSSCPRRT